MPTYEYECDNCGKFEELQKITAPVLETCPRCGGSVHRLISKNIGIIFKGSGFYVTDHRSSGYTNKAGEGSSSGDSANKPD